MSATVRVMLLGMCIEIATLGLTSPYSDLSIHTTIDGACIVSTRIPDEALSIPSGSKARRGPSGPWSWESLHIAVRREVRWICIL